MMKKLMIVAVCAMAVMMSCKNKGQNAAAEGADSDSVVVDSVLAEMPDTAPRPMFLYVQDKEHMQMVYWMTSAPKEDDYSEADISKARGLWNLQQMARRNAAKYTNLLKDDKNVVAIKFIDEVLKNPDGEALFPGELHGRPEIPAPGLRYAMQDPKLYKKDLEGIRVIVCDEYLQSRKVLKVTDDFNKPMPKDIVQKMEKKYGMKAQRSVRSCNIEGGYVFGVIQFKGEYKNAPKFPGEDNEKIAKALALEVLQKGDSVWVLEEIGTIYPGEGPTWNADDDGEYYPKGIMAAFEGPKGLELCYTHLAPESVETGMLYPRGQKLEEQMYECYHEMIDEDIPVWKKDIAEMNKLFQQKNKIAGVKLTKWAHVWMGDDEEWIHMADKDEEYGGIFIRKNGKIQLMQVEDPKRKALHLWLNGISYLKFAGSAGGPSWYTEIIGYKDGKQVEKFNMLEVEGEVDECQLNGKSMTEEAGRAFVEKFADAKPLNEYWNEPEQ